VKARVGKSKISKFSEEKKVEKYYILIYGEVDKAENGDESK